MIKNYFFVFGIFLLSNFIKSQVNDKNYDKNILKPSKAAFFSAVLPGLGQAYNNKIWKLPIVYTALGVSAYSFDFNKKKYWSYRNAYKRRKAGFSDDEFWGSGVTPNISNDGLIRAQKQLKRNKEMSILVTIGLYALNIIDANVDAHLMQYNIDDNLSLAPVYNFNEINSTSDLSLSLKLKL